MCFKSEELLWIIMISYIQENLFGVNSYNLFILFLSYRNEPIRPDVKVAKSSN